MPHLTKIKMEFTPKQLKVLMDMASQYIENSNEGADFEEDETDPELLATARELEDEITAKFLLAVGGPELLADGPADGDNRPEESCHG